MEERIIENEVTEVENEEDRDYKLTAYDETEDDDCEEEEGGMSAGASLLVAGLAVAGAVSIGKAIWKGIGKLRAKAAEKKAAKSEGEIIDVVSTGTNSCDDSESEKDF